MQVSLTEHFAAYVAEQVQSGRFQNHDEVVRAALRLMEESERERERQAFKAAFREIDRGSPEGEPTLEDLAEIDRLVRSVRFARRHQPAA
jgi:antitoxin ParD1/3/4